MCENCVAFAHEKFSGILCLGDDSPVYSIVVDEKKYNFTFSSQWGPLPENLDRSERLTPWTRRVWTAFQAWLDQGKEVGDDGLCVWSPPPDPLADFIDIGGGTYVHKDSVDYLSDKIKQLIKDTTEGAGPIGFEANTATANLADGG